MKYLVVLAVIVVVSSATPLLVQDEDGEVYYLTPVASREKRQAQLFGGGGFHHRDGAGSVGFVNPNGSGGQVSYGHQKGAGQQFGLDARVPVWSNKNKFGESTVNVGGGADFFKGQGGSGLTDKRVGINFNHRF
ncbi:hypothetical protein GWI33_020372 [Rhynchophorus ferrugineus]|uniref:Uncharacterized protein n=1 Tax=Rhynchophorus ferrugineus TaxID=354439 RepID=A0A834HSM7_RHYFE|nr:hypothetical protein GWI33_020372 [Rhynchophorus ferrugineus]